MIPSRFRFPRASRLLKPAEFQAVFDARKACRGQWLTVHRTELGQPCSAGQDANPSEMLEVQSGTSRLGLIVAKRLVPAAARRNLVRRVVREYFRLNPVSFAAGDWIVRLHESPFRIKKGLPLPTRLQIVSHLRTDLTQILARVARHLPKESV